MKFNEKAPANCIKILLAFGLILLHCSGNGQTIIPIQKGTESKNFGYKMQLVSQRQHDYDSIKAVLRYNEIIKINNTSADKLTGTESVIKSNLSDNNNTDAKAFAHFNIINKTSGDTKIDIQNVSKSTYRKLSSSTQSSIDRIIAPELALNTDATTEAIVDTFNNDVPWVQALVNGGVAGSSQDLQNATGTLSLGLQLRLSKFKQIGRNWIDPQYVYAMFNATTAKSADSNNIMKMLLFPEMGKRDFVLGYYWLLEKNGFAISPTFEASLCKFNDTSGQHEFQSESFLFGCKANVKKTIQSLNIPSGFELFLYYNLINIDPKFSSEYNIVLNNKNIHSTFHCLGLQTQIQVDKLSLFCNAKYILNKQGDVTDTDLIRFVYTIGTVVSL